MVFKFHSLSLWNVFPFSLQSFHEIKKKKKKLDLILITVSTQGHNALLFSVKASQQGISEQTFRDLLYNGCSSKKLICSTMSIFLNLTLKEYLSHMSYSHPQRKHVITFMLFQLTTSTSLQIPPDQFCFRMMNFCTQII